MKILIAGAKGQLGSEIIRQLECGKSSLGNISEKMKNATVIPVDFPETDLSDMHAATQVVARHGADVVINCAAFTNVDLCETQPNDAFKGNALVARNLAIACEQVGAKLIHISTDYVFSGKSEKPFTETDLCAPQSVYGKTKLLGEEYIKSFCSKWFIVRTAWLYGYNGNNFVKTIMRVAKEKGSLKVVNDQVGNPTNAEDLAYHILKLITTKEYGIYHATGNGICSWFDFAEKIVEFAGINAVVEPCTTDEFPRPAKRPEYSALDHGMLRLTVGDEMREWEDALKYYVETLEQ